MRLQPQLYIDTSGNPLGEPSFERVDFFDFESIELTSTVQDFRDIDKVFTDYSQTFSLPASDTNNKIFKHYYNVGIADGFDARIKQKAEIYLNGILFKTGYIRLTKSAVSKGKPVSYKVAFFGGLTNLRNTIGNAELSELPYLDLYNHDYNITNVHNGFTVGLELSGDTMSVGAGRDVVYPSISASDKWYYDSSGSSAPEVYRQGVSTNLYDIIGNSRGINWLMLKPAIKVKHIISAIEQKYSSINFSNDFFGTAEFDDLYMLLHNNKGVLSPSSSVTEDTSVTYRIGSGQSDSDFLLDAGSTERRPMLTYWEDAFPNQARVFQYHVIVSVSNAVIAGGGGTAPVYTLEILDGDIVLDRFADVSGSQTLTSVLCTENQKEWGNINVRISSNTNQLSTFELDVELKLSRFKVNRLGVPDDYICDVQNFIDDGGTPVTESSNYSTPTVTQSMTQKIEITRNVPKIKVLDFLTGIFKAFNLTARVDDDGIIVVKPLNDFYNDGADIDITNLISTEDVSVNRMDLFRNIEFEYSENNTFGIINNNEISQTDYGNLEYQATADGTDSSLIFDGKDYRVKLPFEKIYYERLSDENSPLDRTEMGHGWLVDKDQNEVITKPILFFNVEQPVDTTKYKVGFVGKTLISQYNRASNTDSNQYWTGSAWYTKEGTKSLNFNVEFDEFTNSEVTRGLFRKYYQDYISTVFDKGTRVFDLDMKADLSFLLKYKINDTLTIDGEEFLINNIRTDLTSGDTKLELLLKFFTETVVDAVGATLTIPTGLTNWFSSLQQISFNWDANPADQLVKGYKVYVDTVLTQTLLRQTSSEIVGLPANTSYDIQISAYDSQGNESALSTAVSMTTSNVDSEAPTAPSNLFATFVTNNSVALSWGSSTDNIGVTGYEVFVDGVLNTTVTSTTTTIFGLVGKQIYEISVRAKDAIPNYSSFSNSIQIQTL